MKALKVVLFVLAIAISGLASARPPVPIVNFSAIPLQTGSGKPLALAEVSQLIRKAAENRKWVVSEQGEGRLLARLSWNNKHTIVVDIPYTAQSYSLLYKDSVDMNYWVGKDGPSIHPHYNRFVRELGDAIRVDLMTL